jgi:hypothetical protein
MDTLLSERDLKELSEPARTKAFEFLGLLRESGYPEQLALGLALRGARDAEVGLRDSGHFGSDGTSALVAAEGRAEPPRSRRTR